MIIEYIKDNYILLLVSWSEVIVDFNVSISMAWSF